jgi:hypothetical protein
MPGTVNSRRVSRLTSFGTLMPSHNSTLRDARQEPTRYCLGLYILSHFTVSPS